MSPASCRIDDVIMSIILAGILPANYDNSRFQSIL